MKGAPTRSPRGHSLSELRSDSAGATHSSWEKVDEAGEHNGGIAGGVPC